MKMLTDIHNHSTFSFDGKNTLEDMLAAAQAKGVAFFGVSEHFDTDFFIYGMHKLRPEVKPTDTESYFHRARHLQDDYAGVMNVLVDDDARIIDTVIADAGVTTTVTEMA